MRHPLHLCLPTLETFDNEKEEFGVFGGLEVDLEYSLHTISIWESKWKISFMKYADKLTKEQEFSLYECMCITPNVDKVMWGLLTVPLRKDIFEYMGDSMSASKIHRKDGAPRKKETITTELIYCWMSMLNIPYSCDRWHLNRLLKLIEVSFFKQNGPRKMGRAEALREQRELNAARRAKYNTKG